MKSNYITLILGAGVLALFSTWVQAGSQPIQAVTSSAEVAAGGSQSVSEGSMCASTEQVFFSCPLVGRNKVVSMCAAGDVAHGAVRFYYAYGRPGASELVYPAQGQSTTDPFKRAFLSYAGGTGGYAYSFINGQYKYIVYSVSGAGVDDGGVRVRRTGDLRAIADMKCRQGKKTEVSSGDIFHITLKWKSDPDIENHGLPSLH